MTFFLLLLYITNRSVLSLLFYGGGNYIASFLRQNWFIATTRPFAVIFILFLFTLNINTCALPSDNFLCKLSGANYSTTTTTTNISLEYNSIAYTIYNDIIKIIISTYS